MQYAIDLDAHGVVTITFSTAAGTAWLVPALPAFTWGQVGDSHTLPLGEACFLITAVTRAPADFGAAAAPDLASQDLDPASLSLEWEAMVDSLTEADITELRKPELPEVFVRKLRRIVASKSDTITSAFVVSAANFKQVPARRQLGVVDRERGHSELAGYVRA